MHGQRRLIAIAQNPRDARATGRSGAVIEIEQQRACQAALEEQAWARRPCQLDGRNGCGLFSDAEFAEDFCEEIVRGDGTCDFGECVQGFAEIEGEEFGGGGARGEDAIKRGARFFD